MGIGGRHPAGASGPGYSVDIPSDSLLKTNGPEVSFNLDIESLENNTSPFFTTAGGANVTYSYNSAGGASGWTDVFNGNVPAGSQSATCPAASGSFNCSLSISNGDTLQSNAALPLDEGTQQTFTIYAKDLNVTSQLKTLTATTPTKVLIVDGPHKGSTYTVPSFGSMALSTTQNIPAGTASFSFSWSPTDSEANYLSNPGGFLIPVVVTDQSYSPASDSGFPTQFKIPAKASTVWIWAKLAVINRQPSVFYLNGSSEVPLDSANLSFQTGTTTNYTIRIKDPDISRWNQGTVDQSGFAPNYSGPAFTTLFSTGTPSLSGNFIIQDFVIRGIPSNSDIGSYSSPQVEVNEPGDPSLGLAINPSGSNPPRAQVFASSNQFSVPFNMQVIGKPQFLAPSSIAANAKAYAYASRPFTYPLALSISRQNEMLQPFFMGIDQSTSATPVKKSTTGATAIGIYVSQISTSVSNNYVVKWPDSNALNIIPSPNENRIIPVYGVKASYCNVTDGSTYPAITLIRYNETSLAMETCNLSLTNLNTNASSSSLTITLVDNGALAVNVPAFTTAQVERTISTVAPSDVPAALSKQFSDFFGRCGSNCNVAPLTCNANPNGLALTGVVTGTQACTEPDSGNARTGYVDYNYNSFRSRMVFDTASGFTVKKVYKDEAPTSVRGISIMASEGDTLNFIVNTAIPADTKYQYRWYVNGCLKDSGPVNGTTIIYNQKINSQMSGLNNDCTAQYGFAEASAASLGKLVVRLSLVKGNEALTAASEASINSYLWNVSVLNSDPSIITSSAYSPSNPVTLDSSVLTGNRNVQFATPVTFQSKNYFAYTDSNTSTGLKVRLAELSAGGNLVSGSNLSLACDATFTGQPTWMGIQPGAGGKLFISASTNSSYPISGANIAYSAKNQTCFTNNITLAAPNATGVNYDSSGSTVPAGYLGLSKYSVSNRALASFIAPPSNQSTVYQSGANDADFYLIDGKSATSQYWSYSLASMYTSNPTEFQTPYANNVVRRNIVSGSRLFQLIGASSSNSTGWRGFILPSTVAANSNQLVATPSTSIMFSDTASAPNCVFNGTPLDGVYVPTLNGITVDTLYVLVASTNSGKLVAIRNVTGAGGTPTCVDLGSVKNPSLLDTEHNQNLSKMAYDTVRGTIYGIINPGGGNGGQFYSLDVFTEQVVTRDLSATLSPHELIYSSSLNALYLFDNRKSASPALSPTLYKIW